MDERNLGTRFGERISILLRLMTVDPILTDVGDVEETWGEAVGGTLTVDDGAGRATDGLDLVDVGDGFRIRSAPERPGDISPYPLHPPVVVRSQRGLDDLAGELGSENLLEYAAGLDHPHVRRKSHHRRWTSRKAVSKFTVTGLLDVANDDQSKIV